ncbi:YihY/virulence factor BrkB family protein [Oceanihabitans sediminis]|uniref:YihY/virulence factor BrkB family protein n=1 Tax=Oceanihabitans sediminis TaxID=1812012 RepID=A0A368P2D2_9FLAO|nr:YihY/virulence factor BrkB family protein [Oceanihabitans sediminis]MDX1278905.1 YihY/virulence factor BrkB family protein [Oceanihabitans sediminis]MDX1774531.1 YihY/virulence factor BrkB family protein [Oceanihabitans sediminis]RBP29072.1 membrane protein [Oceanihabitans sediminis]RCU57002.1 YihY/virulence factor BrkB family protein [Oceanihabitans sediminis]
MTKKIEDRLEKIPIVNLLVKLLQQIKLPGFEGLSIYSLLELYAIGIVKGTLATRASAIAFSFFMAIFPFLLFVLIVIPYIPIDGFRAEFLSFLNSFLPSNTAEFFEDNIYGNINTGRGGLLSSVFLLSIFLMANGVNAVFSGFETSYHVQLTRNVFKQYLYALGVALILAFMAILTVVIFGYVEIYILQPLFERLNEEGFTEESTSVFWIVTARYIFFLIMTYLATATLYYFGTMEGKNSKFFSVGALLTTLLFILTSYLFGIYINNFAQYNELYGSIGAILILMFYLWLNSNILLLGYELNASLNRLRKLNNTIN